MDPKLYQLLLDQVADTEYSEEAGGPVVKKLKTEPRVCSRPNCGQIVTEDLVTHLHYQKPQPHWRSNCKSCCFYLNPYTKEPIPGNKTQTISTVNTLVRKYHKQQWLLENPTKKPRRKSTTTVTEYPSYVKTVTDLGTATITEYKFTDDK